MINLLETILIPLIKRAMFDVTLVCKLLIQKEVTKYGQRDDGKVPEEQEKRLVNQFFSLIEDYSTTNSDLETETSSEFDIEGFLDCYSENDPNSECEPYLENESSTQESSQE